jgi:hypothetical protein
MALHRQPPVLVGYLNRQSALRSLTSAFLQLLTRAGGALFFGWAFRGAGVGSLDVGAACPMCACGTAGDGWNLGAGLSAGAGAVGAGAGGAGDVGDVGASMAVGCTSLFGGAILIFSLPIITRNRMAASRATAAA